MAKPRNMSGFSGGQMPDRVIDPQPKPKASGYGDLTLHEQENLVQIVGRFCRAGKTGRDEIPDVADLRRPSGIRSLTAEQRDAAFSEAKKRSPTFDHEEITAQARWPGK